MSAFTTPLPTQFVSVEQGKIAFDDSGSEGAIILCVPGMGDTRNQYRFLRPLLVEAGFRVVSMDVRGFGETSAEWNDYSAKSVGSDIIAVLSHLNAKSAIILGNSFAAGSGLWAVHSAPTIVKGVVMLGPIVRDLPLSAFTKLALKIGFGGPWRTWFWTTYWDSLFTYQKPLDHSEAKALLTKNLQEPLRMDALRIMVGLSKAETENLLSHVEVKTAIIMGTKDPDFEDPSKEASYLASKLGSEVHLVQKAGHYPHVEFPEIVAAKIEGFLPHN